MTSPAQPQRADDRRPALLFGVPVDDLTMEETLDEIELLVASGRRQHRTHQVATVNVDFLVNAVADVASLHLLQSADLSIADGMPVLWGAKAARMHLRERVSGADLVPALAARAATNGLHIHLFGSAAGTAEHATELLLERYPGARVTGDSGPMMADVTAVDDEVLQSIADLDPDILCVALGNPKQERFIRANRDRLRTPVMIGVGGTFDLLIGDKKRAPVWVQRIGMEWAFRVVQDPGRLAKRYLRDARIFFPHLASWIWRLRRPDGHIQIETTDESVVVRPAANVPLSTLGRDASWAAATVALDRRAPLSVDLTASPALTTAALTELIGVLRIASRNGSAVEIVGIDARVRHQATALRLDTYLDQRENNR